ncbi:hypothetical protein [Mesomycoplasma hyorhinis]|nr:hypothetical protein [Mesomycoplasma hyorhinis]
MDTALNLKDFEEKIEKQIKIIDDVVQYAINIYIRERERERE